MPHPSTRHGFLVLPRASHKGPCSQPCAAPLHKAWLSILSPMSHTQPAQRSPLITALLAALNQWRSLPLLHRSSSFTSSSSSSLLSASSYISPPSPPHPTSCLLRHRPHNAMDMVHHAALRAVPLPLDLLRVCPASPRHARSLNCSPLLQKPSSHTPWNPEADEWPALRPVSLASGITAVYLLTEREDQL